MFDHLITMKIFSNLMDIEKKLKQTKDRTIKIKIEEELEEVFKKLESVLEGAKNDK